MIRNLTILAKNISKATSRHQKENILALYCGEDWKEHMEYGKRFELLLLNNPKLLLNGLKEGQKSVFTSPTLVKVLPDDSEFLGYDLCLSSSSSTCSSSCSSNKIRIGQEVYGNVIEMPEGSYLISEKQINFLSLML